MADRGKMQANLMVSPRTRMCADQRMLGIAFHDLEIGDGSSRVARVGLARHQHASHFRRRADRRVDRSPVRLDDSFDEPRYVFDTRSF